VLRSLSIGLLKNTLAKSTATEKTALITSEIATDFFSLLKSFAPKH
jgi:hypothetical protein